MGPLTPSASSCLLLHCKAALTSPQRAFWQKLSKASRRGGEFIAGFRRPSTAAWLVIVCWTATSKLGLICPDGDLAALAPSPWYVGKPGEVAVLLGKRLPQNILYRFDVADD